MILIDTGPLVALFDKSDTYYNLCHRIDKGISYNESYVTTLAVLTETLYFLRFSWHIQNELWEAIEHGYLHIYNMDTNILKRCYELMSKYQDLPMDFADASLVAVAEKENISKIFTLDHKDFKTYRTKSGKSFRLLPSRL